MCRALAAISIESLVLTAICLADTLSTLYLVSMGLATEQNPLMAAVINRSPALFVLAKIASFVPFVVVIELYRKRNPGFARRACLWAIGLYVTAFVVLTLGVNL